MNTRLRQKLIRNSLEFIPEGDHVQAAFGATVRPQLLFLPVIGVYILVVTQLPEALFPDNAPAAIAVAAGLSVGVLLLWLTINPWRIVIATDRRILVLDCRRFSSYDPVGVIREVPRNTRITGPRGKVEHLGEPLYVPDRFAGEVAAADAALPR